MYTLYLSLFLLRYRLRPGTSIRRPLTSAQAARAGTSSGLRPSSQAGRPLSGYARPGSQAARPGTSTNNRLGTSGGGTAAAFKGARPGTTRPVSVAGRYVRLGTASLMAATNGAAFIDVNRLNFESFARKPALSKALMDYLLYHAHAPRRALDLAARATEARGFGDWWWKQRLGVSYYQLGLLRDADTQLKSSAKQQLTPASVLALGKLYLRLDQPAAAMALYTQALQGSATADPAFATGLARVQELLGNMTKSVTMYKQVLMSDQTNAEAIACVAAHLFYADQPELALRYYRRLIQLGVSSAETWTNVGLCAFFANQWDFAFGCFDRALALAEESNVADVWYNVSVVAVHSGDHVRLQGRDFVVSSGLT